MSAKLEERAREFNQKAGRCGYPCFATSPCMWCVKLAALLTQVQAEARLARDEHWKRKIYEAAELIRDGKLLPSCENPLFVSRGFQTMADTIAGPRPSRPALDKCAQCGRSTKAHTDAEMKKCLRIVFTTRSKGEHE
jgi:hypothetical protein